MTNEPINPNPEEPTTGSDAQADDHDLSDVFGGDPTTESGAPSVGDPTTGTGAPSVGDPTTEPGAPSEGDPTTGTGAPSVGDTATATMAPPPPPPPAPPARRLVRDPYARLGGVASGIATHYGVDVSIVRIAFVLLTFASGFGLLAYLLAWLVIPRAHYWPPALAPRSTRSVSRRDLGMGMAVVGIIVALAIGGGSAGSFLIPLVLVGGGIWLLIQSPEVEPSATASQTPGSQAPGPQMSDEVPSAYVASPIGAPVPPRSRRRRFVVISLILVPFVLFAGFIAFVAAIVAGVATGNIDINDGENIEFAPVSAAEFPITIDEDAAEVIIDLTALDGADFDGRSIPATIDASLDFGQITVIVPEDIDVSVDASTSLGDVHVFERSDDGIRNDIVVRTTDADVDLNLDVGIGEVRVERG